MNEETPSIHEFDFNLICEYFSLIERQGPGSDSQTLQALQFIKNLPHHARIADIGCGTGTPTITLAQHTDANITAVDLFPIFIEKLNQKAKAVGLENRIQGICGNMEDLPFQEKAFNLIWCEGAIYNIGYQRGLKEWRKFLTDGGYIAVSEVSWLTDSRPAEIEAFWNEAYAEIDTIDHKIHQMQEAGYRLVAAFLLPDECWIDNFYQPQTYAQKLFLQQHAGNLTAEELIKNQRHEAQMYLQYKDFYGYVFYIGKRL